MAQHPFPDPGHDGDEPSPGDQARDWADEDDRYLEWLIAEVDAGRIEIPPEEPSPGVTVSLGEAGDVDLDKLARMTERLSGTAFSPYEAADVMPPGPVLGALTSQAIEDVASLGDDELLGVISAARRQQTRAEYEDDGRDAGAADVGREDQHPAEDRDDDVSFPDDSDGHFPDDGYDEDEDADGADWDEDDGDDGGDGGSPGDPGSGPLPGKPGGKAPLPALTTITVSAGTLLGWSDAPAEVDGFGLLDPEAARDLIAAAGQHPRSRWCVTVIGKDGEAIAHGCASGQHVWTPENPRDGTARAGPDDNQRAQLAELLRQLKITLVPIAKGACDHAHREDRYRPSRKLRHLVRARTTTCPAPGCAAQAIHNEIDHTIPHPDGKTDECNLSPPCSRHHHAKHAVGWKLEQLEPGIMQWTTPSGRTYTTRPTRYDG